MTIRIRPISADEVEPFVEALTVGFLERTDVARVAEAVGSIWDLSRTTAAFDGDRIVGTFRSWPTELTVPGGGRIPASAIAAVTVRPTHRRRGILRSMITAEHAAMRERGEAIGLLYASEYPIYGRFGYGPATREATWSLDTRSTGFLQAPTGSIDLVTPDEAVRDAVREMFDTTRRRQVGSIRRRDVIWDFDLGLRPSGWGDDWKGFLLLHRDPAGDLDGFVRYSAEDKWEDRQPRAVIRVDDLHALDDDAYHALWSALGGLDWVAKVTATKRSPSERLPWLLSNARGAKVFDIGDGLWARLDDLPRALEARTYAGEGSVVLEAVDVDGGRVRLALDAGPDGARCRPTRRSSQLTLGIAALGAAYLGGPRLRDAVLAAGFDDHRRGTLARLERLLRTADEPYCSTFF